MIQNLKNIIKLVYFDQLGPKQINTKYFKKYRPKRLKKHIKNEENNLKQLCELVKSSEKCQNWIIMLENYKQYFIVKQELYNAIIQATVNVHNLFLMIIQCRVLPSDVWIPIQNLCQLKGDKDNQLCCLIHFTVMNMGQKNKEIDNPATWCKRKAEIQMGPNFQAVYNYGQMCLQDKITILPMLIVLNNKNSIVLWDKLKWLYNFPYNVIMSLRCNMTKLLEEKISTTLSVGTPDYFTSKMCIKSIQLLEVEGFVSMKNLFGYAYELYNISMILQLLANYKPAFDKKTHSFRLQIIEFLVQLFDCMNSYEFQFDFAKNNKQMDNLKEIIVKNKLYMEQLNDIRFNQQLQSIIAQFQEQDKKKILINKIQRQPQQNYSKVDLVTKSIQNWIAGNFRFNQQNSRNSVVLTSLAKIIPRCSSEKWLEDIQDCSLFNYQNGINQQDYEEDSLLNSQKSEQKIIKFCNQRQQTILNYILCELYHIKTDYLLIIYSVLSDCYQRQQQAWSQISSSFYKLQIYLAKNYLLQFLIYNYNSIETKNSPLIMISYYKIIGLLLRGNPIVYAKIDKILYQIQQQSSKSSQKNNQNKYSVSPNILQYFVNSFIQNIALSKSTIIMILSDQFQWKENEAEGYSNAIYDSYFVNKVIEKKQLQWMTTTIQGICRLRSTIITQQKQQNNQESLDQKYQRLEWITLLLTLYYYFQETVEIAKKNKKQAAKNIKNKQKNGQIKDKQKIKAPNKAYLDKILEKQKFMQKLYPKKIKVPFYSQFYNQQIQQTRLYSRKQRILNVLIEQLDKWQQFFNTNSKKTIIQYSLSFPMLKVFKKKLKNRIKGFMKTKEYQENGQQFYFKYMTQKNQQAYY